MLIYLSQMYQGKDFIVAGVIYVIALVVSFTLHEFAHAFVAYKCGDDTPKYMGRVTLNPLAHIDPLGFIFSMLFFIGWAKPVEVNPIKFKHYRKDMALVSSAGVITNFIIAFFSCGIYMAIVKFSSAQNLFLSYLTIFFLVLYSLNIGLAVFNFLPVYPLDGYNFLNSLTKQGNKFMEFMRAYGQVILLVIMIACSSFLSKLIGIVSYPILLFWGWIF